ncbi:MAG: hypothetical protein EOM25_13185 [Deltaproteobacteria bacterium]|nr:hypothetical protein [Deltaproteobacteria bacterium]
MEDNFTLHAAGLVVDRPTFEALLSDTKRWTIYLSMCKRRGPQVPRLAVSHNASDWGMTSEGVATSKGAITPAPLHPFFEFVQSLNGLPAPASDGQETGSFLYGMKERALVPDLAAAGYMARMRSTGKGRDYRQALLKAAAKDLKGHIDRLILSGRFYAEDGEVRYMAQAGELISLSTDHTTKKTKEEVSGYLFKARSPAQSKDRPGWIPLSGLPQYLEPKKAVDALNVIEELADPVTLQLVQEEQNRYRLYVSHRHAHDLLVENGLTEGPKDVIQRWT